MKRVYIVGTAFRGLFIDMFEKRGYEIVDTINKADIVQFTGGADIDPSFYNQHQHPTTYTDPRRDAEEYDAFREAKYLGKFMAGVCRGGQLLNALSGGSMYQDVEGHGIHGTHGMLDVETNAIIPVSSVHHQMMILGEGGVLLGESEEMRSRIKHYMTTLDEDFEETNDYMEETEVEACYYPETKSFCFQPHPEFVGESHPCREWYFNKLEELYVKV